MTRLETTQKIHKLRDVISDEKICALIGISKPTLYTRLNRHNWKLSETTHIEKL
jgi:hypothetical protein